MALFVSLCVSFVIVVGTAYVRSTDATCAPFTKATDPSPAVLPATAEAPVSIPKPNDWVDYGPVLEAGPEGSWDFLVGGTTPASVVKKDDTYYFYYVASDGYRSHDGEGDRHRSIGVATSEDGIRFTKYHGNPIMTHAPFNGEEEGANSAGVTLSTDGDFVMYYGAAIGPKDQINADGRVAVSKDGYNFRDVTMVLDHRPPFARFLPRVFQRERVYGIAHRFLPTLFNGSALHGHGDEIFPVATFQHNRKWHVYYEPNGGTAPRTLGLAWGPSFDRLPCSAKVLDGNWREPVGMWGNVIWLAPDKIGVFVQKLWWPDTFIEVRTASPDAPHILSEPVERYDIPNLKRATVFLDKERRTWFMYYNAFDRFWRLKLAPAGEPDSTPPTAPRELTATAVSHDKVILFWQPASDPDTGVVLYNIYRNGIRVGSTKTQSFTDTALSELTRYSYAVAAVNFHGYEGAAQQVTATTAADTSPPTVVSVTASQNPNQVTVVFSKAVDGDSAENIANYALHEGLTTKRAALQGDRKTVTLETSTHRENVLYALTIKNIRDRAATANAIMPGTEAVYGYSSVAGLLGYWNLSEKSDNAALDRSGNGNDAKIHAATWQGRGGGALHFNGTDSYLVVENRPPLQTVTNGSFTFAAWVNPEDVPPSTNAYGILLRVGIHPAFFFGLSYVSEKKFDAQLIAKPDESATTLRSGPVEPGIWSHVAMVVDNASKGLHLYVDGEAVSGSPIRFSGAIVDLNQDAGENHSAGEYYIGSTKPNRGSGSFFNRYFKGLIAEARIYDRALSAAEVRHLFSTGTPDVGIGS